MSVRSRLSLAAWAAAFAAAVGGAGLLAGLWGYNRSQGQKTQITNTAPSVIRLEKLAELATVRVHVADVLKAENTTWAGSIKGAWLIKGDALLSVDMKLARVLAADDAARTITVRLPPPRVIQPRVDHNRTVAYDWQKGWLRSSDVADSVWKEAMKHAQELVGHLAAEPDQIDMARSQTEAALREVYASVGWKLVVVWEDRPATTSHPL